MIRNDNMRGPQKTTSTSRSGVFASAGGPTPHIVMIIIVAVVLFICFSVVDIIKSVMITVSLLVQPFV